MTQKRVRVPRSKMISIRFTEQEYAALELACLSLGVRHVSDFLREAIRVFLGNKGKDEIANLMGDYQASLSNLGKKIEELESRLAAFETSHAE